MATPCSAQCQARRVRRWTLTTLSAALTLSGTASAQTPASSGVPAAAAPPPAAPRARAPRPTPAGFPPEWPPGFGLEEPRPPPPTSSLTRPQQPVAMRWYGWQNLIAYAIADTIAAIGAGLLYTGQDDTAKAGAALMGTGFFLHPLGGAIVHWAHRRPENMGWKSFGMNWGCIAGGALLGAGIAAAATECAAESWFCSPGIHALIYGMPIGAGVGMLLGATVDAAVFAREPIAQSDAVARARRSFVLVSPLFGRGIAGLTATGAL